MNGIFQSPNPPPPWRGYDWEKDSLAVIASDGQGNGFVLWTVGVYVRFEMDEVGLIHIEDLGLGDAPIGISIWEGKYAWCPGPYDCPQDGSTEPVGSFRDPTDEEWASIRAGECPWNDEDWKLKTS